MWPLERNFKCAHLLLAVLHGYSMDSDESSEQMQSTLTPFCQHDRDPKSQKRRSMIPPKCVPIQSM